MTKYEIYDTIISRASINLISLARRHNNEIILKNFHPHNIIHLFMFEMAAIASNNYEHEKITLKLEMPWYRKIFAPKRIRCVQSVRAAEDGINIQEFLDFTKSGFEDISYEEIWKEYYAQ